MSDSEEEATALSALNELVAELGLAFHPEMPVESYVRTASGDSVDEQLARVAGVEVEEWRVFEPADAEWLQQGLDLAWSLWGDGVFDVIKTIEPWKTFFEQQGD